MTGAFIDTLTLARCTLVGHSRSSVAYCRDRGIKWTEIEASVGLLRLADIMLEPRSRFSFARPGTAGAIEAAVIEAIGEDSETVEDLVAWPISAPDRVLTCCGGPDVLGKAWATNPASFFGGEVLHLYRTPLAWLKAGCQGAAVIDIERAARWHMSITERVLAVGFAADLRAAALAAAGLDRIVVPKRTRLAA